jgi:hypothetical protein
VPWQSRQTVGTSHCEYPECAEQWVRDEFGAPKSEFLRGAGIQAIKRYDPGRPATLISGLGGHLKTGHTWTLQNRPTDAGQDTSIYNLNAGI